MILQITEYLRLFVIFVPQIFMVVLLRRHCHEDQGNARGAGAPANCS